MTDIISNVMKVISESLSESFMIEVLINFYECFECSAAAQCSMHPKVKLNTIFDSGWLHGHGGGAQVDSPK